MNATEFPNPAPRQRAANCAASGRLVLISLLLLAGGAALAAVSLGAATGLGCAAAMAAVLAVAAMAGPGAPEKRAKAELHRDSTGKPRVFLLCLDKETVSLDPGKNWTKVDEFKWVTRGLLEAPQSFHVLPNGTVDINDEKISLEDPEGIARLEREINKRRVLPLPSREPAVTGPARPATPAVVSGKVRFRVKLDAFRHFVVECGRGEERVEAGMRGLSGLVQNGLMLKPKSLRVDPMQRCLELDGTQYECTPEGALQLEQILNDYYAPLVQHHSESAVEIKENPASASGFDIRFVTVRAGARFEIKGHLSQEKLDILHDPAKCDLLHPGIILRVSPPYLLVRRRRPDGGEEHVPELPDVHYRRATAVQLQELFNHPLVHRTAGGFGPAVAAAADQRPAELVELRVAVNPQNRQLLWLESTTTRGGPPERKAFTYHNIVDLQHQGFFQPHLEVALSLDNRTLHLSDKQTRHEQSFTLTGESTEEELKQASQALTAALKPPAAPPAAPQTPLKETAAAPPPTGEAKPEAPAAQAPQELPQEPPSPPSPAPSPEEAAPPPFTPYPSPVTPPEPLVEPTAPPPPPSPEQALAALFAENDAARVNAQVFRRLTTRFGLPVQDVLLSLPRVFTDRRFEIINFSQTEVGSILELRSEAFYGFYLSHNDEQNVLLVYACKGHHLEWGPKRCLLQAAVASEADEFKGGGLLGLAQSRSDHFMFVVRPEYREWARAREKAYEEVYAHFITVKELAANRDNYTLIWPEPPASA